MAVKGGGGQNLAVNFYKFGTKLSLGRLWLAFAFRENKRQTEVSFYHFCVYKRQIEYTNFFYKQPPYKQASKR